MQGEQAEMAKQLHSEMMELTKKAHAMGLELTGVTLKKYMAESPHLDFGNCTTECGFDENGHYRCWTHCP